MTSLNIERSFGTFDESLAKLHDRPEKILDPLEDDDVENVKNDIYRIGCIHNIGNSFLHCIIKSFSTSYNRQKSLKWRETNALLLRVSLIASIVADYEVLGGGSYSIMASELEELRLESIAKHLLSSEDLSLYLFRYICRLFDIGIYFVTVDGDGEIKPVWILNRSRINIVVLPLEKWTKFELVSVERGGDLQTSFSDNDPFTSNLKIC